MAVTLAQARLNVTDDLQVGIIDEFRKSSYIMEHLPFADAVSPVGGGATLTYSYTRLITQPVAEFRKVNAEFGSHEVEKQRYSTDLKIMGGKFDIDRVIAGMGGIVDEVMLQASQKVKATSTLFSDTIINGNSSTNEDMFDGLDVAVTGTDTEFNAGGTVIDLSTTAAVDSNYKAFVDLLDEWTGEMDGITAYLCNSKMAAKFRAIARRMGQYQVTMDGFGRKVEHFGDIPFIDLGAKAGSNNPIVGINDGVTSLYAVRFGMDGFHGVSMAGQPAPMRIILPKWDTAGAVKQGEVEFIAGCALKSTKAAGVLRNIKVQ